MIRSILFLLLLPAFIPASSAWAGTLTASLGFANFPEGIGPVPNRFTLSDLPGGVFSVSFYIEGYNGIPIQIDNKGSDGWTKEFDMGGVEPGATLHAVALSVTGDTLDYIEQPISVIPAPLWLRSSTISGVSLNGTLLRFTAAYPVQAFFDDAPPRSVPAMGGRKVSLFDIALELPIEFDIVDRARTITAADLVARINVFNQKVAEQVVPIPEFDAELDNDLNLRFVAGAEQFTRLFSLDFPGMRFPVTALISIRIDGGAELYARLYGKMVIGPDDASGEWGFVRSDDKVTGVGADLFGKGWIRGSIDVLFGLLSASGRLDLRARLGAAVTYESLPEEKTETLFGGALGLYGTLKFKALWWTVAELGPKRLFFTEFGELPDGTERKDDVMAVPTAAGSDPSDLPMGSPEPTMASVDTIPIAVWMERRGDNVAMRLSQFAEGRFGEPVTLHEITGALLSPSLIPIDRHRLLVVWNQSDFMPEDFGDSLDLIAILNRHEIRTLVYDTRDGSIGSINAISGDQPGTRPTAIRISDDEALVVWMALAPDTAGTLLWSRRVSLETGDAISGPATAIPAPVGVNNSPTLLSRGDGSAILVWTHSSANLEERAQRLLRSTWDGSGWSSPEEMWRTEAGDLVSSGASSPTGAWLGVTETSHDENGKLRSCLTLVELTGPNAVDTLHLGSYCSDINAARNVDLSIAPDGRLALAWTDTPIAADSTTTRHGERRLTFIDLEATANQRHIPSVTQTLSDTAAFVWEATATFGADGTYYQITQELGGAATGGVPFADASLDLVLRTIRISRDGKVEDVVEPGRPVSGVEGQGRTPGEMDLSGW